MVLTSPLPIVGGSGSPCRALALVERAGPEDGGMRVADAVGQGLAKLGAEVVFGVVGSGNFHVTNALIAGGSRFVAARHEGGATVMADAWARTDRPAGLGLRAPGPGADQRDDRHRRGGQEPHAAAGAAPRRRPEIRSNFYVDVAGLAAAVGAAAGGCYSPASALADAAPRTRPRPAAGP